MRGFVCAILLLFPAVGSAQMVSFPTLVEVVENRNERTITYGWLRHAMGFTICLEGQGYSFIQPGMSLIDRLDTEAHEATHREQYARFPSCEAFDDYARSPRGRFLVELEAYTVGLCVSVKLGADRDSLERNYAERIYYWVLKGTMPEITIVSAIKQMSQKLCPV